jgi:hypothetical protein
MRIAMGLFFASAVLVSCGDLGNESPRSVTMQIDGVHYSAGQSVAVATSNGLREMIAIAPCCTNPDFRIQQRQGTTWTMIYPECDKLMCPSVFIPLNPGAGRIDSVRVQDPGVYRLMLRYQDQRTLQIDSTYSTEFTVQ